MQKAAAAEQRAADSEAKVLQLTQQVEQLEQELQRSKTAASDDNPGLAAEAVLAEQEKKFAAEAANLKQSLKLADDAHLGTKEELDLLRSNIAQVEAAKAEAHSQLVTMQQAHAADMAKTKAEYEKQLAAAKAAAAASAGGVSGGAAAAVAGSSGGGGGVVAGGAALYSTIYYEEAPDVPSPEISTEEAARLISVRP